MISRSVLLAILAILPCITQQEPIVPDSKPDWTKCGISTKCFCLDEGTNKLQPFIFSGVECKLGFQNIFFTEEKAVFQMYVDSCDPAGLGSNPQLMFLQGDSELFGCELNSEGKIVLKADKNMIDTYEMALFEGGINVRFKGTCLCAVKVDNANDFYTKAKIKNNELPKIKLNSILYEFNFATVEFATSQKEKCDPYAFKDLFDSPGLHIQPLINREKDILNCNSYGKLYSMKYIISGQPPADMMQLECKKDPSTDTFLFEITESNPSDPTTPKKIDVIDPELYTFYCAANIGEVCVKPESDCTPNIDCPQYTMGDVGTPATITCPGKKWLLGNEYVVLKTEPICEPNIISNPNDAQFFISRPSESKRVVEKGDRCFKNYNCTMKAPLQYGTALTFSYNPDVIKCNDSSQDLSITFYEANATRSASSITCDTATGFWRNTTSATVADGEIIDAGSAVSCASTKPPVQNEEADLSDKQLSAIIGGVSAGIVCLIVAGAIAVYCCCTHRSGVVGKKAWLRKSRAERFHASQELFGKVLKTTPTSYQQLIFGLRQIDLLLETETEDPRIWKLVYPFLMRMHGAVSKMDHSISHMYARYLYIQGKKIIDKHGWISPKPIRKKKQKGLIRAVAIRLLGFSLSDQFTEEAHELLEDGFRKLGFNAIEQYPHCGMMWSIIPHARVLAYESKKDEKEIRYFNYAKFGRQLLSIALSGSKMQIPEDEVIPSYGQVAQQAAFALGAWQNYQYHRTSADILMLRNDPNNVALGYFAGMCGSLSVNPTNFILEACGNISATNDEYLKQMHAAMTEEKVNETIDEAMRLMTYYGRGLDAKKVESRFTPTVTQPSAVMNELQAEQRLFESALDEQLEKVRGWFADNTDKPELKAKPEYILTGKVELDSRVNVAADKPPPGIKPSTKSGSDSKSNAEVNPTGSNSTNERDPSTPEVAPAVVPANP